MKKQIFAIIFTFETTYPIGIIVHKLKICRTTGARACHCKYVYLCCTLFFPDDVFKALHLNRPEFFDIKRHQMTVMTQFFSNVAGAAYAVPGIRSWKQPNPTSLLAWSLLCWFTSTVYTVAVSLFSTLKLYSKLT